MKFCKTLYESFFIESLLIVFSIMIISLFLGSFTLSFLLLDKLFRLLKILILFVIGKNFLIQKDILMVTEMTNQELQTELDVFSQEFE